MECEVVGGKVEGNILLAFNSFFRVKQNDL